MLKTTVIPKISPDKSKVSCSALDEKFFRLWVMITQVNYAVHRAVERQLPREGITFEQAGVLLVTAYLGDRATPAKIAQWLFRMRHSTHGVINRMVKQGLVTKNKDLEREKEHDKGRTDRKRVGRLSSRK